MVKPVKLLAYRHKMQIVRILCLFLLLPCVQAVHSKVSPAQPNKNVTKTIKKDNQQLGSKASFYILQQKKRKKLPPKKLIYLEHADSLYFDVMISPDFQILSGNVRFRHEHTYLYCDSAHFFPKTNSLYAFGNVHMEQGDTLFLYGAWLYYDGNTKLAMVREKVRLENRRVTLFTDSLNYDRISNIGYFFDGGLLVDDVNK
ncbi:MAG: hypothetical protein K8E24_015120, partial [Methanobacterium paludis]|nr:hypothetical protein [Methanobacterium paludis]